MGDVLRKRRRLLITHERRREPIAADERNRVAPDSSGERNFSNRFACGSFGGSVTRAGTQAARGRTVAAKLRRHLYGVRLSGTTLRPPTEFSQVDAKDRRGRVHGFHSTGWPAASERRGVQPPFRLFKIQRLIVANQVRERNVPVVLVDVGSGEVGGDRAQRELLVEGFLVRRAPALTHFSSTPISVGVGPGRLAGGMEPSLTSSRICDAPSGDTNGTGRPFTVSCLWSSSFSLLCAWLIAPGVALRTVPREDVARTNREVAVHAQRGRLCGESRGGERRRKSARSEKRAWLSLAAFGFYPEGVVFPQPRVSTR